MPRLVMVGGASGAGKSFLLKRIEKWDTSIEHVKKLTTRSSRVYETEEVRSWLDLKFDRNEKEIDNCEYKYEYASEWYGIRKIDIESVLMRGQNPLVIVRDCETIRRIKRDYNNAFVLYLQSGLSGEDLKRKLQEQGREDIEINDRMERLKADLDDFVAHRELFDEVIINYFEVKGFEDQVKRILTEKLPNGFVQPDLVFVLMPFKDEFDEIYLNIKMAGKLINGRPLTVDRMDEKRGPYMISDTILNRIRQSSLIVAEVTEDNANVYFEIGYARGIGKMVLPCAKAGTTLPFDIKNFNTVFYRTPTDLTTKLAEHFKVFFPYFACPPK